MDLTQKTLVELYDIGCGAVLFQDHNTNSDCRKEIQRRMNRLMTDHATGLYLKIRSEPYQVECKTHPCDWASFLGNKLGCKNCKYYSTGQRTVQLVGYVAGAVIHHNKAWIIYNGKQYCKVEVDLKPYSSNPRKCFCSEALKGLLMDSVFQAYRTGTLPPELLYDAKTNPDGLREAEVTT